MGLQTNTVSLNQVVPLASLEELPSPMPSQTEVVEEQTQIPEPVQALAGVEVMVVQVL
jgi:hypothetical protein